MTARAKLSIGWTRETPGAGWSIPKPSPEARKPSVDSKPPQGILRLPQWIRTSLRGRDALYPRRLVHQRPGHWRNLAHSFWEISLPTSICADGRKEPKIIADHDIQRVFYRIREGPRPRQARVSVDFKHGNAESMPLAAESFDLIGLGVALDRACPAWFGWSGFPSAATLVTGITWFAGVDLVPELTLWAAPSHWSGCGSWSWA